MGKSRIGFLVKFDQGLRQLNFCLVGKPKEMKEDFKKAYKIFYKKFEERYKMSIIEVNEDFTSQAVSKDKKKQDYDYCLLISQLAL